MMVNTLAQFSEYYGAHNLDKTAPYAGIPELLARLRKTGIRMAVYSNKADEFSREIGSISSPAYSSWCGDRSRACR